MGATIEVKLPPLHPGQAKAMSLVRSRRFVVIVAGRRWGKTRLASAVALASALSGQRVWWVAPTHDMARAGLSDIVDLASQVPGADYRRADRAVLFPGGGSIWVRSADRPQNLRAFGIDLLVLDEAAYLKPETWNTVLRPALADRRGRALIISTPAGKNWFYELAMAAKEGGEWGFYHAPTWDNPLIAKEEIAAMEASMPRRAFLQEIAAEFLDREGALWSHDWIRRKLVDHSKLNLVRIVVGVDPAASEGGDETGIVVAGRSKEGLFYVLADRSVRGTPETWRNAVIRAYKEFEADVVVAEANQGGDMVRAVIHSGEKVPVKLVRATRGKITRAEPIAALYERGLVYHVGVFRELESQLTGWEPGEPSPDRMDALVWALTELASGGSSVGVYSVRV